MTLKKVNKTNDKNSSIFLISNADDLKKTGLNVEELKFAQAQLKSDKKNVIINHYNKFSYIQLVEPGKTPFLRLEACRKAGHIAAGFFNINKIEHVNIIDLFDQPHDTFSFTEGFILASYQFLKYKSDAKKKKNSLHKIDINSKGISNDDIKFLEALTQGVCIARDLVNEPVTFLTAIQLGKEAEKVGKENGIKVEVFNKAKIASLKMGGLLAVNMGSIDPPTFTVMEYKPKKAVNKKPLVLVGKGVVYDTGGLSLKPTPGSMDTMKCDMGGAAAVIGVMHAIAKAEIPVYCVGLIPATDNRPGGNAITPGDVITISDGTTVEVLNTDAEGRLILSDALVYAKKYDPELVIDLATLTGVAARTIGQFGIVAMGNATDDFERLKSSGNMVHERLVEFPLWDEYGELIKSDIADLKNIGGAIGGVNTAGKFLEHFTDYPWIHLDIAGTAFVEGNDSYRGKGGTGSGVRLLFDFIKNKAEI
jgi:leucyl aminopeptidase